MMSPGPASTNSTITLNINGEKWTLAVDHRTTLLDALRERLGTTLLVTAFSVNGASDGVRRAAHTR